jgi:predicted nicotinamide N-methyase
MEETIVEARPGRVKLIPDRRGASLPAVTKTEFEYKLALREERIGGHLLRVEALENLDHAIDELFERLARDGRPELLEELCPYFGVVWPSARGLCEELAAEAGANTSALAGRRLLELGCGLALPSLLAAKLGAEVTATDVHPDVPRFLGRNLELNAIAFGTGPGRVRFEALDWRKTPTADRFDWVVGSDILYEREHPGPVARALASRLAPGGRLVLTDPGRPYLQGFSDEMRGLGFAAEVRARTVADNGATKEIFILRFSGQGACASGQGGGR